MRSPIENVTHVIDDFLVESHDTLLRVGDQLADFAHHEQGEQTRSEAVNVLQKHDSV